MATSVNAQDEELVLISATPSPFARMNRIAMIEKGIPFTLQNEVPWNKGTETPKYNPLEKLPILLFPSANPPREPVYDSTHIQEYILAKYPDRGPKLLPGDVDGDLKARQIVVLSQGLLDAFVLSFWETQRKPEQQNEKWLARQNRKIDGALGAMNELVKSKQPATSEFVLGDVLTIADIAIRCALGNVDLSGIRPDWKTKYAELSAYIDKLDERESFRSTAPYMFDLEPDTI